MLVKQLTISGPAWAEKACQAWSGSQGCQTENARLCQSKSGSNTLTDSPVILRTLLSYQIDRHIILQQVKLDFLPEVVYLKCHPFNKKNT